MGTVVFTNGCFDVLHAGHIDLLEKARALGDRLVVGINSDRSVRAIKGDGRPINSQVNRKAVLLGLRSVDEVRVFDDQTPDALIREIRPDVLVKGGDWKLNEIVGAEFVASYGGTVTTVPLVEGLSSSSIIDKWTPAEVIETDKPKSYLDASIDEHIGVFEAIKASNSDLIEKCGRILLDTFKAGKKVLICGNGGSAADAQHLAAEFVGRYEAERRGLPAIALTTDTSALTALANDYDFERVFARQIDALAAEGDCLIAISTSGNSPNVISAVMSARRRGCTVVGMTGAKGKKLASLSDACFMVPSERTARIQEAHIAAAHIWCEFIDAELDK